MGAMPPSPKELRHGSRRLGEASAQRRLVCCDRMRGVRKISSSVFLSVTVVFLNSHPMSGIFWNQGTPATVSLRSIWKMPPMTVV